MEITAKQFALIERCLPRQRGNVSMTNLQVVNAVLYVAEHGCKWRGLPKRVGNWHIGLHPHAPMGQGGSAGQDVRGTPARASGVRIRIEAVSLDSTNVKVHPDGTGALKKNGPQAIGQSRGGWNTKVHLVAGDARTAETFCLSPGQAHDSARRKVVAPGSRPEPMKASRRGSWRSIWASSGCAANKQAPRLPGNTTARCTSGATKSKGCSGGSKATAESSRASRNSTRCSSASSTSRWCLIGFEVCVNTP